MLLRSSLASDHAICSTSLQLLQWNMKTQAMGLLEVSWF